MGGQTRRWGCGYSEGISFFLFSSACRDGFGDGSEVQPTESRGETRDEEAGGVGQGIFYSRCVLVPANPPSPRVLPRDTSSGSPGGLDVFDESIRGYFRYANSLSTGERLARCTPPSPCWTMLKRPRKPAVARLQSGDESTELRLHPPATVALLWRRR